MKKPTKDTFVLPTGFLHVPLFQQFRGNLRREFAENEPESRLSNTKNRRFANASKRYSEE